ncbi:hypothetical protein OS493_009384 [Desmophyllum pertusum]|uniref:Uncharacterized protein n=1 Tax=Desmophyllum pertusum TaxID=174260 RepID=A0A9X0CUL1_9CNID|nr:hypothetical protein OS493_009384 [Desmophyllum pertusum]
MKSIFVLCAIFVLIACCSSSPVAKKSKFVEGFESFAVESQRRSRRSLLPGIVNAAMHLSEEVSKSRNKRSANGAMLKALAQFQEGEIASNRIAKILTSDLVDNVAEEK